MGNSILEIMYNCTEKCRKYSIRNSYNGNHNIKSKIYRLISLKISSRQCFTEMIIILVVIRELNTCEWVKMRTVQRDKIKVGNHSQILSKSNQMKTILMTKTMKMITMKKPNIHLIRPLIFCCKAQAFRKRKQEKRSQKLLLYGSLLIIIFNCCKA